MDKTRKIIIENEERFPEFQYYFPILDEIEKNIDSMPDIAIESCKALVEGVSKTILKKLKVLYTEEGRGADSPKDLLKKVLNNIPNPVVHDPEFITRSCELISRITEIRNKRGDISHGRPSPKEISSDKNLSEFISQVTDGVIYYLLKIYFNSDLSYLEDIKYENNVEFNDFLDSEKELDGVLYSMALFDQDFILYKERLSDYILYKEEDKNKK